MNFQYLIIRIILGLAFGVIISRFFFHKIAVETVLPIAFFLIGMAYVSEYFKKK